MVHKARLKHIRCCQYAKALKVHVASVTPPYPYDCGPGQGFPLMPRPTPSRLLQFPPTHHRLEEDIVSVNMGLCALNDDGLPTFQ